MSLENKIIRRKTKTIKVGNVDVGGNSPISVQSMTNTLTKDVEATVKQINELADEGADIVRVSCPDKESTESLKKNCRSCKRSNRCRHTLSLPKSA